MTRSYIHFDGRLFRPVSMSPNSQTTSETIFKYDQRGDLITAVYSGGGISFGQLIAVMLDNGKLDFRYHHITSNGDLRTGMGTSEIEYLPSNKLRLHEKWQWTSGDKSYGASIVEEI